MLDVYRNQEVENPEKIVKNLLKIFDRRNEGGLRFREFIIATHLSVSSCCDSK